MTEFNPNSSNSTRTRLAVTVGGVTVALLGYFGFVYDDTGCSPFADVDIEFGTEEGSGTVIDIIEVGPDVAPEETDAPAPEEGSGDADDADAEG